MAGKNVGRNRGRPPALPSTPVRGSDSTRAKRAPNHLGRDGKALWAALAGRPWLTDSDIPSLVAACRLADEVADLREWVTDNPEDWRTRAGLRAAEKNLVQCVGLLGGNPADRARLGFGSEMAPLDQAEARTLELLRQATG